MCNCGAAALGVVGGRRCGGGSDIARAGRTTASSQHRHRLAKTATLAVFRKIRTHVASSRAAATRLERRDAVAWAP